MNEYALTEHERRIANLVRIGTVTEIDVETISVKVELGDDANPHESDWIRWGTRRAGEDRTWDPPDVGEQVIVLAPGGELDQAFVWGSLYSDDNPANGDNTDVRRVTFKDGSVIEYDREESKLNVTLNDDAVFTLKIGTMEIKVTKDGAELGGNATNFVALANKVLDELNSVKSSFDGHQHNSLDVFVGTGALTNNPTSPPLSPMTSPQSVAASKVKAE
jgi:phage baseplate assembly protein V